MAIWYLAAVVVLLLYYLGGSRGTTGTTGMSVRTYKVEYKVTGSAHLANVTIETPQGTEQRLIKIPYSSPTYTFQPTAFAYISAQNQSGSGDVTVAIIAEGSTIKQATSEGAYVIASVSWSVGRDK